MTPMDTALRFAKAIVAFIVPAAGTILASMQDWSAGGSVVTGNEWLTAFLVAATASTGVGVTANKDPKGLHQDESVQPRDRGGLGS